MIGHRWVRNSSMVVSRSSLIRRHILGTQGLFAVATARSQLCSLQGEHPSQRLIAMPQPTLVGDPDPCTFDHTSNSQRGSQQDKVYAKLVYLNSGLERKVHFHCSYVRIVARGYAVWAMQGPGELAKSTCLFAGEPNQNPVTHPIPEVISFTVVLGLVSLLRLTDGF